MSHKATITIFGKRTRHFWSILLKEEKMAPSSNSNLELMESFIKGKKGSTITWRKRRNLQKCMEMRSSPHSFSPFTKYQKYPLGVNSKVTHPYKSPNVTNFSQLHLIFHLHFLSPLTNSLNSIFIFFISAMSRTSHLPSSAFISMSGQIA